jgi:hypothetical protein
LFYATGSGCLILVSRTRLRKSSIKTPEWAKSTTKFGLGSQ